jgi:hypothetical protein
MSRKAFLVAVLALSTGVFGQQSGGAGGGGTQPGTTEPAGTNENTQQVPANMTNGLVINGGYVTNGPYGTPIVSTPGATFASPAPTAGITNAGRAGISANTPVNTGVSTLGSSTMVYTNVPPVVVENSVNGPATNAAAVNAGGGRLINDMGPSYYADALPAASNVSLGEVAAQLKASKGAVNARMLTNDDVDKMVSDKTGVTVAKNMPPLGPGAMPQSGGAATGAQTQTTQTAQSSATTGQQSQGQQPGTPPPSGNQGQAAGSEATANSTTPQIQNQQSNDAQGKGRLPATSTLLPLFGLLGLLSGGVGLWFRKMRR